LFNVNAVGPFWTVGLIGRWTLTALRSAPIGTAPAAVEVTAASLIVIHRHGVSTL
jgi:hypothetical protein